MNNLESSIKKSYELWAEYAILINKLEKGQPDNPFLIEMEPLIRAVQTGDIEKIQNFNSAVVYHIARIKEALENQ